MSAAAASSSRRSQRRSRPGAELFGDEGAASFSSEDELQGEFSAAAAPAPRMELPKPSEVRRAAMARSTLVALLLALAAVVVGVYFSRSDAMRGALTKHWLPEGMDGDPGDDAAAPFDRARIGESLRAAAELVAGLQSDGEGPDGRRSSLMGTPEGLNSSQAALQDAEAESAALERILASAAALAAAASERGASLDALALARQALAAQSQGVATALAEMGSLQSELAGSVDALQRVLDELDEAERRAAQLEDAAGVRRSAAAEALAARERDAREVERDAEAARVELEAKQQLERQQGALVEEARAASSTGQKLLDALAAEQPQAEHNVRWSSIVLRSVGLLGWLSALGWRRMALEQPHGAQAEQAAAAVGHAGACRRQTRLTRPVADLLVLSECLWLFA